MGQGEERKSSPSLFSRPSVPPSVFPPVRLSLRPSVSPSLRLPVRLSVHYSDSAIHDPFAMTISNVAVVFVFFLFFLLIFLSYSDSVSDFDFPIEKKVLYSNSVSDNSISISQ